MNHAPQYNPDTGLWFIPPENEFSDGYYLTPKEYADMVKSQAEADRLLAISQEEDRKLANLPTQTGVDDRFIWLIIFAPLIWKCLGLI